MLSGVANGTGGGGYNGGGGDFNGGGVRGEWIWIPKR
jgi:hypothetical protein